MLHQGVAQLQRGGLQTEAQIPPVAIVLVNTVCIIVLTSCTSNTLQLGSELDQLMNVKAANWNEWPHFHPDYFYFGTGETILELKFLVLNLASLFLF